MGPLLLRLHHLEGGDAPPRQAASFPVATVMVCLYLNKSNRVLFAASIRGARRSCSFISADCSGERVSVRSGLALSGSPVLWDTCLSHGRVNARTGSGALVSGMESMVCMPRRESV